MGVAGQPGGSQQHVGRRPPLGLQAPLGDPQPVLAPARAVRLDPRRVLQGDPAAPEARQAFLDRLGVQPVGEPDVEAAPLCLHPDEAVPLGPLEERRGDRRLEGDQPH